MTHFYKHIGRPFESNIWHKLAFLRPSIGVVISLFGVLFLLVVGGLAYVGFKAKAHFDAFFNDVRQHFVEGTGCEIADPDRGTDELCKTVKKSKLGFMFLLYAATGWMFASREERYEVFEPMDTPKLAWWEFKKKSRFAKAKNMRRLVDDALNRHWLFHLRNPMSRLNWQAGHWTDDNSYSRHLLKVRTPTVLTSSRLAPASWGEFCGSCGFHSELRPPQLSAWSGSLWLSVS